MLYKILYIKHIESSQSMRRTKVSNLLRWSFRIKAYRKNVLAKCVSKDFFLILKTVESSFVHQTLTCAFFHLAVRWRHNAQDEAAEETSRGQKEDETYRQH